MRWSRDRSWRTTRGARCGVGRVDHFEGFVPLDKIRPFDKPSTPSTFRQKRSVIETFSQHQALYNLNMSHEPWGKFHTDWIDWMAEWPFFFLTFFQVYYIAMIHWCMLTIISAQRILRFSHFLQHFTSELLPDSRSPVTSPVSSWGFRPVIVAGVSLSQSHVS